LPITDDRYAATRERVELHSGTEHADTAASGYTEQ
jgi:hypothetical protein